MTNETYTMLLDSMDRKERNEGKEDYYTYIKLESGELKDFLVNLVYSDDGIASGDNNLNYDVLYDAVAFLADNDITLEKFIDMEVYEVMQELERDGFASIYTSVRLEYLNMFNESDIMSYMEEYGCSSISEACAVYYDNLVEQTIVQLQDYVVKN